MASQASAVAPAGMAAEASDRPLARQGRRLVHGLTPVAGLASAIVLWEAVVRLLRVPPYLVPAPTAVWDALVANRALLLANTWPTVIEALAGFALGNAVAVLLAIVFVHNKVLERAFYPVAITVRTIPIVAVAPVLVILLGNGLEPKIAIAALISFFPTLVNMVRGLEAVDRELLELMHVLSATKREVFFKVRLYSSLPYLFSALKIATTSSVLGAIVAEWIGTNAGLGYLIIQATYDFRTPLLYATMAVASLIAVVFFAAVGVVERRVVRWQTEPLP